MDAEILDQLKDRIHEHMPMMIRVGTFEDHLVFLCVYQRASAVKSSCAGIRWTLPALRSRPGLAPSRERRCVSAVPSSSIPIPAARTRHRRRTFRLILWALPLLLLVLVELALRGLAFGYPTRFFLPTVQNGRPVWIENAEFGRRYFPPGLERAPRPIVIPRVKPPETMRIFVFGESAALGDPEPSAGFARVLEVLLRSALPGKRIEVINVAMTAINSHVVRDIAKDCARLEGDYWIVYLGHNEVVGPYGAGTVFGAQTPPRALIRAQLALKTTRTGQLLDALRWRLTNGRTPPASWKGQAMFLEHSVPAEDPRLPRVYENFEANLREILTLGTHSGAKVIVSSVAANLRDCAPFGSAHRQGLKPTQLEEWSRWYQAGLNAWQATNPPAATGLLARALAIDHRHAGLHYLLGRAQLAAGQTNAARESLELALNLDPLRFRADTRINQIIRQTAATIPEVRWLDLAGAMTAHSADGLPGAEFFHEHVHFNFEGNYAVATQLAHSILGSNAPSLLSSQRCAEALAWTDFDRYRVLDEIRQRLEQPPFIGQLDHAAQLARIQALMKPLKSSRFSETRVTYERAIAAWPDDWSLRENFGTLLNDFQQFAEALDQWRRMTELLPHSVDACLGEADALEGLGRRDEAVASIRRALHLRPNAPETWHALGLVLARAGRDAEAVTAWQRAVRLRPGMVDVHLDLGTALARLGHRAEAAAQFQEVLRQRPDDAQAKSLLRQVQDAPTP